MDQENLRGEWKKEAIDKKEIRNTSSTGGELNTYLVNVDVLPVIQECKQQQQQPKCPFLIYPVYGILLQQPQ